VHDGDAAHLRRRVLGEVLHRPRGDGPAECDLAAEHADLDVGGVDVAVVREPRADLVGDATVGARALRRAAADEERA
jgi:hypothetical protein